MKKKFVSLVGSALSLLFIASAVIEVSAESLVAKSYTGLGKVVSTASESPARGLDYSEIETLDADGISNKAYIFEYDPAGDLFPIVSYGGSVYGKKTLGTLVEEAWAEGFTVFGAVNGDFYSTQTGVPLGIIIKDGRVVSSDDNRYAVGFTADNKAIIGKPSIRISMTNLTSGGEVIQINHLNKYPTAWGSYLFTEDYGESTHSSGENFEIVIEIDGEFVPGGKVQGKVREIRTAVSNTPIPEGCAVITIAASYDKSASFAAVQTDDLLQIDVACDPAWTSVVTAVGGGDLILKDSVLPEDAIDEYHEKIANPRTAIGIKEDGKVIVFAVDGRSDASKGLSEAELSAVMSELGCTDAINLDGGGSTTVMVKHFGEKDIVCSNAPSAGALRSIANGILLVKEGVSDGKPSILVQAGKEPWVLSGSSVDLSAVAYDCAYVKIPDMTIDEELVVTVPSEVGEGKVGGSADGRRYTSAGEGRIALEISAEIDGITAKGIAYVNVVEKPDSLKVYPQYAKIAPGTKVDISVTAEHNGDEIISDIGSFDYTINGTYTEPDKTKYPDAIAMGDIGYIDAEGNFVSFEGVEGKATIGISAGGVTAFTVVNSGLSPDEISYFNDISDLGKFSVSPTEAASEIWISAGDGRRGSGHAPEVGYSCDTARITELLSIKPRETVTIPKLAESIRLWVRGSDDAEFEAIVKDDNDINYRISYKVTTDYSKQKGWREITAKIPSNTGCDSFTLVSLLTVSNAGSGSDFVVIDDACIYYGKDAVRPLAVAEGHWATAAAEEMFDRGIIADADCEKQGDKLYYDLGRNLTRGEFAKLMSRFMGYDEKSAKIIPLSDDVSEDELAYISAVINAGLMRGYGVDESGRTIFNSTGGITRQEVFKVIGATLDSEVGELTFSDADQVADWAAESVSKCVSAGIVGGYGDNTIRPTAPITRAELLALFAKMS